MKYPFVIPVSVRIEEAFLIHANTRTIPIQKKIKHRPGIGQAIPVSAVGPIGPAFFLAVVGGEDVLADAGV